VLLVLDSAELVLLTSRWEGKTMRIALSHGGSNIYSSSSRSQEVLVATKDGVIAIERVDNESHWNITRQSLKNRHISSIIIEPQSGMIFAGAFFGSVYASSDGGKTWEERGKGITYDDVYSLSHVRRPGGVCLYAGTEPAHLFYSQDLGLSWTELSALRFVPSEPTWSFPVPPHIAHVKFITVDPNNSSIIYACIEQGALLKSVDCGESWVELNTVGFMADKNRPAGHFYDVHKALIDPRDPNKIFVTGGAGLYVTFDGGSSWERWMTSDWEEDVYPDGLVLNPKQPDTMLVSAAQHNPRKWRVSGFSGSRIYRSTDKGRTWESLCNGLPDRMLHEFGALCLEAWGDSFSAFAGTTGGEVYCSDDGGDTWSLIISGLKPISKKGHEAILGAA
jgi:photosystem II stability/assembly factor-like uncharacterized protein